MTQEELDAAIKEVDDKLLLLPEEGKKLTNKEWRQQVRLKQEKEVLVKIKKAIQNGDTHQEIKQTAQYMLLRDSKKMHPIISYILQLKLRSHVWM